MCVSVFTVAMALGTPKSSKFPSTRACQEEEHKAGVLETECTFVLFSMLLWFFVLQLSLDPKSLCIHGSLTCSRRSFLRAKGS